QLTIMDRSGLLVGGGVVLAPTRLFSIGLAYEHLDLGSERLQTGSFSSVNAERDAHTLWADLRVFPVRTEAVAVFAGIGVGLAWQSAQANYASEVLSPGGAFLGT